MKLIIRGTTLTILLAMTTVSFGAIGDVWDLLGDFGTTGSPPTGESGVFPIPNSNFPGALGDLYGHGPHLIKWTSPIAGDVSVTGVLEQLDSSQRHMGWTLSKNGGFLAGASIFPTNNAGELNAFGPQVIDVGVGDTIEFETKYFPFDAGEEIDAWVSYGLTVEQVVPEPTTNVWDLLGDFSTTSNPNVTTAQVDPATWSYHDGRPGGTFGNLLSAGTNPWGGSDPGWVNATPTRSNPNVTTDQVDPATWSYHDGRPGETFGDLLSAGNNPWGGSDPGWVNASPTGESGVFPIPNSNFPWASGDLYGHGPHLIKWTSPVAGTVSVTGVLEQLDSSQRHMGWALSKNGGLVAEASIFPTNNAEELNAFGPQVIDVGVGDTIEFVTKYFDTGEAIDAWVSYGLTVEQVVPAGTPGDFDGDGDRDGADFLLWQRGGSPNPLSQGDLADWETNFGAVLGLNSLAAESTVPEPSGTLLAIMAMVSVTTGRCLVRGKV